MNKSIVNVIVALVSFFAFSLCAKPKLDIRLLNSFTVDTLESNWNYVRFCVADTLLLVIDTADSTQTKSYAFDFQGNLVDTFIIPPDSGYVQLLFVNYLWSSKRVAVFEPRKANIEYYYLDGTPAGSREYYSDWSLYLNTLEYYNLPYFTILNMREAEFGDMVTGSMTWCREESDGEMQLLRKECIIKDWLKPYTGPFQYKLLMDNNKDQFMTMVDERDIEYVVTNPDTTGWNISRIKRRKYEYMSRIITGENYFMLLTWNNKMKFTHTSGVYDTSGMKLLNWKGVKQYIEKGENIIDIVGDKMLTYNYKESSPKCWCKIITHCSDTL